MIEMYLLEALAAVDECGTLSAAAEKLRISQPALSRSMKKLEGILNVELFERTKNRITLNETGRIAADYAGKILRSEKDMVQAVRSYDNSLHMLSVGYCAPGPMRIVPATLARCYPELMVTSGMYKEEVLARGLREDQFSMVILTHPLEEEGIVSHYLCSEHLYVSAPPDNELAKREKEGVYFREVDGQTFLQIAHVGIWDEIKARMIPHSRIILQEDQETLNAIINTSSLLAFASDISISTFRRKYTPGRVFVPLLDEEATVRFYCAMKKRTEKKLSRWIEAIVSEEE